MICIPVDWLNSYDGNRSEPFDHELLKDNHRQHAHDEFSANLCMCLKKPTNK